MMNTETFQKQYPIALIAIGKHIAAHELPAPTWIDTVDDLRDGRTEKALRVYLPGNGHQAWLASVHLDGEETEPSSFYVRRESFVRLPDTGIRIRLIGFEAVAVQAVSA